MKREDTRRPEVTHLEGGPLGVVDALAQLSFAVQGALAEIAAESDLSIVQTRLLGVLRDRTPGMHELARHLNLDKSSITGLVDRAEKRGLVRRRPSATDGRGVEVHVTPAGRRLVERVELEFGRRMASLLEPLDGAQQEALSGLASRIVMADATARGVNASTSDAG